MSSTVPPRSAPRDRNGFQVAIFCALPLEAENVQSVFDVCWEDQDMRYGKAVGDQNSYTTGMIGNRNVVLVHVPSMGGNSAALAAAGLRSSFSCIKLAFVVGICGVVPEHPDTKEEIFLGDVVISSSLSEYDLERQDPSEFRNIVTLMDVLYSVEPDSQDFPHDLTTGWNSQRFSKMLQQLVLSEDFQTAIPTAVHPGVEHDRLYEASYPHQHRSDITSEKCVADVETCPHDCELNCKMDKLVNRHRRKLKARQLARIRINLPLMHAGAFGSTNSVMNSGVLRDRLSAANKLTAFGMEHVGVCEEYPTIIIMGACDYADGHNNKHWHAYAAAMAAGALKVLLEEWSMLDQGWHLDDLKCLDYKANVFADDSITSVWHVPQILTPGFVGRDDELRGIEQKLLEPHGSRIVAVLGSGGMGKSCLSLEFAFRIKSQFPTYWILWVQASNQLTFENDMIEIGMKLGISGIDDEEADVKTLVKQRLSRSKHQWIMILDDADDFTLWGGWSTSTSTNTSLVQYLPRTQNGAILITTRARQVASFLAQDQIIELSALSPDHTAKFLATSLEKCGSADDRRALSVLVDQLAGLPLALATATSYIDMVDRPIQIYLDLIHQSETVFMTWFGKGFADWLTYDEVYQPVITTCLISLAYIQNNHPFAATVLSRMAFVHEKSVPKSLLQYKDSEVDDLGFTDVINVLKRYSFVTVRNGSAPNREDTYNMHALVQLAIRIWLRMEGIASTYASLSTARLLQLFPEPKYKYRRIWTMYLPHARHLYDHPEEEGLPERYDLLEKMGLWFALDGQYDEAVKAHTLVVGWREKLGGFDYSMFEAYRNLGEALMSKGELSEANYYFRRAFGWLWLRLEGNPNSMPLRKLALARTSQEEFSKMEPMIRRVREVSEWVLGEEHRKTLTSVKILATVLSDQGKYSEAPLEGLAQRAQEVEIDNHSDISDVSYILHETSSVTTNFGGTTESKISGFNVALQLATVFREDETLPFTYQVAASMVSPEKLYKNHDRLLKRFFEDIMYEAMKVHDMDLFRLLQRHDWRDMATTRLQQMFRTSVAEGQQNIEVLENQKPDRRQILASGMDPKSSQNMEQANEEVGPPVNHDFDERQDNDYSDSSSGIGDFEAREVNYDFEPFKTFIKRSHAFISFKTQLNYMLLPPSNLSEALASRDPHVTRRFLTKNFESIALKEYQWLHELSEAGYSKRELSELLLEDANDSPWIYFSPQVHTIHKIQHDCHIPECAHGRMKANRTSPVTLGQTFQDLSHSWSDVRRKIEELCGIAGIAPTSRDTEAWYGTVMFDGAMTTCRITYAINCTQHSEMGPWIRLWMILSRFLTAVAILQEAGLCCDSFTVIHHLGDHLELRRLSYQLVEEMSNLVEVVVQRNGYAEAVQQCVEQAKMVLQPLEVAHVATTTDENFNVCALATQFVCTAFLSYVQAHAGPIKPFFLDTAQRKLVLLGSQDLTAQSGIDVRLVELACLSGVIKDHVLAFSVTTSLPEMDALANPSRYHVLTSAEDLLDTWGPGHLIYDNTDSTSIRAIKIGGGIISASNKDPSNFHWTEEITSPTSWIGFPSTSKILIGAIVDVNTQCDLDRSLSRDTSSCALENLNTHLPYWNLIERQSGFQGGQYFNINFVQVWQKNPGKTLKERALEQSEENLVNLLEKNWGVQVSFCTSVACRVSLRQVLADLLPEFVNSLDHDKWQELTKVYGIIDAFAHGDVSNWLRQLPAPLQSYVLKMIKHVLEQLRNTGFDRRSNTLKVAWPHKGDIRGLIIPCATLTYWALILDDAHDCATFAYITTKCIQTSLARCQGGLRAWQNVSKMLITEVSQYRSEGYPAVNINASHQMGSGTTGTMAVNSETTTTTAVSLHDWRLRNQEVYFIKKFDLIVRGKVERSATDIPHLLIEKSNLPLKIWERIAVNEGARRNHYIREKQMTNDHAEWVVVRSNFS